MARFGRLGIAVNNAGTEGTTAPSPNRAPENFEAVFHHRVLGVLLSTQSTNSASMIPQGSGSIVNISSVAGRKGIPGASVYTASKHAVEGLTQKKKKKTPPPLSEADPSGVRSLIVA